MPIYKNLGKKGLELSLTTIIVFIILGIFFIVVVAWYFGLRDKMVEILSNFFG